VGPVRSQDENRPHYPECCDAQAASAPGQSATPKHVSDGDSFRRKRASPPPHVGVTQQSAVLAQAGRTRLGSPRTNLLPKYNIWPTKRVASPLMRLRPWRLLG
jgi:hypothetical protein